HQAERADSPVSANPSEPSELLASAQLAEQANWLSSLSLLIDICDRRGRLKADIIEACECLRAWYGKPQAEGNSDIEDSENEDD
ncbi:hypothetical protein TUN199_11998, partial [Pyrenophora tritici-repentis]